MVWSSIFCSIGMFFGAGYYTYRVSEKWNNAEPRTHDSSAVTAAKVTAIVLFVIGGLLTIITIFLRKQIMLAMSCVKQAARSIASMPIIMTLPILQTCGFFAFGVVWLYYAVHLASMGTLKTTTLPFDSVVTVRSFDYTQGIERFGWYLLFCFFWSSGLISAVGSIIVAMRYVSPYIHLIHIVSLQFLFISNIIDSTFLFFFPYKSVAKWYFTRDKKQINSATVLSSVSTTLWYHVGTAAFGSLIIAIIQLIRAIITKLQKKAKQMDSKCAQAILCCCQCCVFCFEKCMKFINKNAYIQTAIFGTSFCTSAKQAFFLILRNALRIGSIGYVSTLVVFMGKIFISITTTGLIYMAMDDAIEEEVHSLYGPVIFAFLISYFVADMFMDVFDMSTSTILQCFIADEEMFSGDQNFADGKMRTFLSDYEKSERQILVSGP